MKVRSSLSLKIFRVRFQERLCQQLRGNAQHGAERFLASDISVDIKEAFNLRQQCIGHKKGMCISNPFLGFREEERRRGGHHGTSTRVTWEESESRHDRHLWCLPQKRYSKERRHPYRKRRRPCWTCRRSNQRLLHRSQNLRPPRLHRPINHQIPS